MFNAKEVGKRIAEIREKERFLQGEFAEIMEVSKATLSYYERGIRKPDIEFLYLLSDKFNVDLHWLVTGEAQPVPKPKASDLLDEGVFYAVMDTAFRYGYYKLLKGETPITLAKEILEEYARVLYKKNRK